MRPQILKTWDQSLATVLFKQKEKVAAVNAWKGNGGCCCCCYGGRMRPQILKAWDQSLATVLFKHYVSPLIERSFGVS
jgi:hypothetical protein